MTENMAENMMKNKDLQGKRALITGASRGIGRAVAVSLAAAGADVIINYAGSREAAEAVAEECRALGVKAYAVAADVSRANEVGNLFAAAVEKLGGVDILVNNAGITRDALLPRLSEQAFDEVINTNLKGNFLCMQQAGRLMMKQRYGRIINISSVVGVRGNAGQANYAAAKAGVIGLTKTVARELASRGVTVNAIAPGFIETDMTAKLPTAVREKMLVDIPAGRMGQPQDVAAAVRFLASDAAAYITGQVLCVDGGMAM